jgi:hypothetical protein
MVKCHGLTRKGEPCQNIAWKGGFCRVHQDQQQPATQSTKKSKKGSKKEPEPTPEELKEIRFVKKHEDVLRLAAFSLIRAGIFGAEGHCPDPYALTIRENDDLDRAASKVNVLLLRAARLAIKFKFKERPDAVMLLLKDEEDKSGNSAFLIDKDLVDSAPTLERLRAFESMLGRVYGFEEKDQEVIKSQENIGNCDWMTAVSAGFLIHERYEALVMLPRSKDMNRFAAEILAGNSL